MLKKLKIICLAIITISVISFNLPTKNVTAQTSLTSQSGGLTLTKTPENPEPNQSVVIKANSYSINIDSSTIRWYVDDVLKKEGIGEKTFNLQTGKSGEVINIRTEVITYDGRNFQQELSILPSRVDILVESDSYTPPLYKGKAYFVGQGTAKIIAVPDIVINGEKAENSSLNFKWEKNGMVLGNLSGTGRNTLIIEGEIPMKDIYIKLDILNTSRNVLASKFFVVSPQKTQIVFYENSSLYGLLLNKSLVGNYSMGNKEEIKIVAKPYFFNISSQDSEEINYKWTLNNKTVSLDGKKNELILRQNSKDPKGKTPVRLKIEGQKRIFQFAENNFNILFGE
ncbi:MAG: hypothetical protein WC229_03160 [Candidatus Paceibacterota bacterium]|jgi:hypothetical protein